ARRTSPPAPPLRGEGRTRVGCDFFPCSPLPSQGRGRGRGSAPAEGASLLREFRYKSNEGGAVAAVTPGAVAMELVQKLSLLALRQLLAGGAAGGEDGLARVTALLTRAAADPRLADALARAQAQAWKALDIVVAGGVFWNGCQVFLPPDEC